MNDDELEKTVNDFLLKANIDELKSLLEKANRKVTELEECIEEINNFNIKLTNNNERYVKRSEVIDIVNEELFKDGKGVFNI